MRRVLMLMLLAGALACGPGGASSSDASEQTTDESTTSSTTGDATSTGSESGGPDTDSEATDTGMGSEDSSETTEDEPEPCQELVVDLTITDATDPASVSCVRRVNNRLRIEDTSLTDLSLLPALEYVERMSVFGNPELLGFGGLDALQEIGLLSTGGNPKLQDFSGLVSLTRLDNLYLSDNVEQLGLPAGLDIDFLTIYATAHTDLSLLDGFAPAPAEGEFFFGIDDTQISSLEGLYDCCSELELNIDIYQAQQLGDLSGLEPFTSLASVRLFQTYGLTSLAGLETVELGWLEIVGDHCFIEEQPWSLLDLSGLGPEVSIERLDLISVHSLENLDALQPSLGVSSLSIYNNTALPQALAEAAELALAPEYSFVCGNGGEPFCFPEPVGPCPQ